MNKQRFRLVTRSDLDGLVCAILLQTLDLINGIDFAHPQDVQDGLVAITGRDITANLPFCDHCYLAFDHHLSETSRIAPVGNHVIDHKAPSTARVIYRHYGGKKAFPGIPPRLLRAVDQADTARYGVSDILQPKGWTLLNFIMDPRTGLERLGRLQSTNREMMLELIDCCPRLSIRQILALPKVRERVDLYRHETEAAIAQIRRLAIQDGRVILLNLLDEETIHASNRFMVHTLFPGCEVSIHAMWTPKRDRIVLACGKSIINRSSKVEIGSLMLKYGGGGLAAAGSCQVRPADGAKILNALVHAFNA